MSSTNYSAELIPDAALRRTVIVTGILATAGGAAASATLPVLPAAKLIAAVLWSALGARELTHIAKGNKTCSRIEIDATGTVQVFGPNGCCRTATIDSGSIVLRRVAWLRLRGPAGERHAELLGPGASRSHDWRRFQVIWRHLGAAA